MTKITWQHAQAILAMIVLSIGGVTYGDLFGTLFQLKGIEYNFTGDITCGTECPAYINLTTSYWTVRFDNYSGTKYDDKTVFKKVTTSRTLHANTDKIKNIITTQKRLPNGSWVPYDIQVDWMVPTYGGKWRLIKNGDSWDRKKINKIKLVGHKNPEDTIKWSFGFDDYVDIDPLWVASVKWHDNCQIRENNGKFNMIIGQIFWVNDSDNKCKPIKEAKSLKNSPVKCVITYDGKHKVECLDWNLTHRKIRFDTTGLSIKARAQMIIKIMKPNKTINGTVMAEKAKMIKSFVIDPIQDMWLGVDFNEVIHFGENSTTIQLQVPDTENLADSSILQSTPDVNEGDINYVYAPYSRAVNSNRRGYIKFNISNIPTGVQIDNSVLSLYFFNIYTSVDTSTNVSIHHVYNDNWIENIITWNNQPCGTNFDNSTQCNLTADNVISGSEFNSISANSWVNFDINEFVQNDYDLSKSELSLIIKFSIEEHSTDSLGGRFYSKEYTPDSSLRPYLNITYSSADETTPPTHSNNGHNTTEAGKNILFSILYNDDTALETDGQYIFSTNNTGTWTNESAVNFTATPNWANVSKILNSTEGLTISYRWYADDNAGNINDTEIFTLITTSADTYTYSGSGNWDITCNDNCSLESTNLNDNNFTITGTGFITNFRNIYNYNSGTISEGCTVTK